MMPVPGRKLFQFFSRSVYLVVVAPIPIGDNSLMRGTLWQIRKTIVNGIMGGHFNLLNAEKAHGLIIYSAAVKRMAWNTCWRLKE